MCVSQTSKNYFLTFVLLKAIHIGARPRVADIMNQKLKAGKMRSFQEFPKLSWRGCNMSVTMQYVACQLSCNMSQWRVSSAAICHLSSIAICQLSSAALCRLRCNLSAQLNCHVQPSSATMCRLRCSLSAQLQYGSYVVSSAAKCKLGCQLSSNMLPELSIVICW